MRLGGRRGRTVVVVASLAAHAAVLAVLALHVPRLKTPPPQPGGPPEPIIPILLMPRALPPSPATGERPTAIRLHRRPQRFAPGETPVEPLIIPETEAAPPDEDAARRPVRPSRPAEDPLAANARNALRSRRNCDDPGLTRVEREACMDRLFAAGRDAAPMGLGLQEDKASDFARAARRKEEDYKYKRAPAPAGNCGSRVTDCLGNDRPALKVPF